MADKTVVLVACVGKKLNYAVPAGEMYQSPRQRTGFPSACPTGRAAPRPVAAKCLGCEFHRQDKHLYWRCDHPSYQNEPGIHFCLGCGVELGFGGSPNIKKNEWPYCGGSSGKCRYDTSVKPVQLSPDLIEEGQRVEMRSRLEAAQLELGLYNGRYENNHE